MNFDKISKIFTISIPTGKYSRSIKQPEQVVTPDTSLTDSSSSSSSSSSSHKKYATKESLIHSLLEYDPSPRIILKTLKKSPSVLFETDSEGRLPIHIAVIHTVHHSVIKTLIKCAGKDAKRMCSQQDKIHGKTPLHMAIEAYDPRFYDLNQELVIKLLFDAAPLTALMEDSNGHIPLEIAFLTDLNTSMLYKLQGLLRPIGEGGIVANTKVSQAA